MQSCHASEWIVAGPSETGKTLATLYLADSICRAYPNVRGAIVRKTYKDVHGTVLETWRKHFVRDGVTTYGGSKAEWYDYPNGSRIYVGGMDNPGKVLSGERDFVYVNQAEELSLPDWETLTTRTTGRAGNVPHPMAFGDCNPGAGTHWIINRPSLKVFHSRHEDNPRLFTAAGEITDNGKRTLMVLDNLTGVRKERLRYGRWVSAEGAVYQFDPALHLIDPFPIPADWARYRVIDFGFVNPFVCQWWAVDNDGRIYLYREIYMTKRTVRTHAALINQLSGDERYQVSLADHDAEDRATLEENGIWTIAAEKDISTGIEKVQERLKVQADGKPRLFVLRGALVERDEDLADKRLPICTEQEFDAYMWPKAQDGRAVKDVPVKLFDHGMDSVRYLAKYLDYGAGGKLFWE